LRSKYLLRYKHPTFQSVVLAGVYDVKTLKLKLRNDEEKKYNSPWNIAADFKVNLSLNEREIAKMLTDYSASKNIDIDSQLLSEKLLYFTSGHPFLVSKMCKIVDEEILPGRENKNWSEVDVEEAFKRLVNESYSTTNFDDMIKNLENNPELYDLVFKLIMDGDSVSFNIANPVINLGNLLGILSDSDNGAGIHNKIYQQRIYNYMSSKIETSTTMEGYNFR
ncbi:MAG: AAA family ATPase, partial [bacterium]|nr:AAA family ATPase [bacterium]